MLQNWFWQKYLDTVEYKKYYSQQYGAPHHISNIVQIGYIINFALKSNIKKSGQSDH